MREIFFRGKRLDNGDWVYGAFTELLKATGKEYYINSIAVKKETIGQYIGLRDKNGVMIFEDDIVKWRFISIYRTAKHTYTGKVIWSKLSSAFTYKILAGMNRGYICKFDENRQSEYEVVGNIYDNPKLLEV